MGYLVAVAGWRRNASAPVRRCAGAPVRRCPGAPAPRYAAVRLPLRSTLGVQKIGKGRESHDEPARESPAPAISCSDGPPTSSSISSSVLLRPISPPSSCNLPREMRERR